MATPVVRGLGYALAALVSVVAVVAYASRPPAIRSAGAPVRALTASYNASGHDLFAQFAAESPGNIVLSPYSIGTAMAMIMSGARGDTATEMATALRHTLPRNEIDAANGDLLALFDGYDRRFWQIWPSVQLKTANALMVLKRGHDIVSPRYAALLHDKYRTQLFRDAGLAEVNGWVRRQTEGKIEKIVDEILPGEVLAILNAVYFKATWQSGFRRSDTRDADFQVSRSVAARVPTMHQEGDFAMLMRPDYQAIRLPYRNAALAMVIVMPNDVDGATKLVRDLDADALADLFNALTTARAGKVELALPRFTARFKASLNEALATAGIRRAFGLGSADFSGMTGDGLLHVVISRVEHSAFIDVTEEGTEAAAVTGGVMLASASPRFAVDRPFLFYITDSATGAILVQGRISDPRPQS